VHVIDVVTPHSCCASIGVLTVFAMPHMEASLLVKIWLLTAIPPMHICHALAECVAQPPLPRPLPHAVVLYQLCYHSHLCKVCAAFCHRVHVVDTQGVILKMPTYVVYGLISSLNVLLWPVSPPQSTTLQELYMSRTTLSGELPDVIPPKSKLRVWYSLNQV